MRELYVEGGSIVHGRSGPVVGEEAVTTMMDLDEGRVVFNWQLSPEKRTVSMLTEELMSNWAHREEEWKKIEERSLLPADGVFSIVVDSGGKDRTILEKQWGVLALCNGMRSVSEVAAILGRNVVEVVQTIGDMVGMGVLEKAGSVAAPKPKNKDDGRRRVLCGRGNGAQKGGRPHRAGHHERHTGGVRRIAGRIPGGPGAGLHTDGQRADRGGAETRCL